MCGSPSVLTSKFTNEFAPNTSDTSSNTFERLKNQDLRPFLKDLEALREEIQHNLGPADLKHLYKIENWGKIANLVGVLTAGLGPNPLSVLGMGFGRSTRWLLMHHIGHRGYDKVPGVPKRYTSRYFAKGWRRWVDWPDWMTPESWCFEHNVMHHHHTGQEKDPDLLERNTEKIRQSELPLVFKQALIVALGALWKPIYYVPSNVHALHEKTAKGPRGDFRLDTEGVKSVLFDMYLPYALWQFVVFPSLFLPAGPFAIFSAFLNSLWAEILTNVHTFAVVGPNHTGSEIWRFDKPPAHKAERMLHQIMGSVNYRTGGDVNDYLHLWLNYQIEHHVWPDLPMLKYQQYQPRVEALCKKHGIPYLEMPVGKAFKEMLDVTTGEASMQRA